jgi:hypothetical protein
MSDATEMAAAMAELTTEDPVTVTDQRGYTFTARKPYALGLGRDMQDQGYLTEQEMELLVPVANLPTQRPVNREKLTVAASVYQVTDIEQAAGAWLIRGRFLNQSPQVVMTFMDAAPALRMDGTRKAPMQ